MNTRRPGYRLIYMNEVKPVTDWLRLRGSPAARELCETLEEEWGNAYVERAARTAFVFYPAPAVAEMLGSALSLIRTGVMDRGEVSAR